MPSFSIPLLQSHVQYYHYHYKCFMVPGTQRHEVQAAEFTDVCTPQKYLRGTRIMPPDSSTHNTTLQAAGKNFEEGPEEPTSRNAVWSFAQGDALGRAKPETPQHHNTKLLRKQAGSTMLAGGSAVVIHAFHPGLHTQFLILF